MAPISWQRVVVLALLLTLSLLAQRAPLIVAEDATSPSSSTSSPPPKSARDDDPVIQNVRGLRNAAMRENDRKSYDSAIEKLREALTLMNHRVFGEGRAAVTDKAEISMDAAFYAQLLTDYGSVLIRAKQHDEAIDVLEDAVEMIKRVFDASHPSLGLSLRSLADAHLANKNYKVALEKYRLLRTHIKKGLGMGHEGYVEVSLKIAEVYKKQGKSARAVKALKQLLDDQGGEVNGATAGIGEVYMELSTLQLKARELDDAERFAQSARVIMQMRDGQSSINHAFSLNALAGVKMAQGKVEEVYTLLQEAHAIAVDTYGRHHAMVEASSKTLAQVKARLDDERAAAKKKKASEEEGHIEL